MRLNFFILNLAICILLNIIALAQCPYGPCGANLIPNPDFEITSSSCGNASLSCIMFYDTSKVESWWGTAMSSGGISQSNTSDYSNPACVGIAFGCNNFGAACSGAGHVWLAESNYEYIQAQLLSPLQSGKNYCFTFTYRLGFNTTGFGLWVHNLGKILHSGPFCYNAQPPVLTFSTTGGSGCQVATLNFTATGGETWILIGPTVSDQEITLDNFSLKEQCLSTGLDYGNGNSSEAFQILPNPSNGIFTIANSNNLKRHFEVAVYNVLGQKMYQSENVTTPLNLDFTNQAKGMYLIQILDNTGRVVNKKLILVEI